MIIAQFGTFDVSNYGDLLFPLITLHQLSSLPDFQLQAVSPIGGRVDMEDCETSIGIFDLVENPGKYDAALIGGGNIIHTSPTQLEDYNVGVHGRTAYADLWIGPSFILHKEVPIIWNAPGVSEVIAKEFYSMVSHALKRAQYLSVRDEASRQRLLDVWPEADIAVIPDSAWDLVHLWSVEQLKDAYAKMFAVRHMTSPEQTVVFHVNNRYIGDGKIAKLAKLLDKISFFLSAQPILIAMGRCHNDHKLARVTSEHMTTSPIVLDNARSLKEIAACISHASAYVGSSMHGLITASSFGVPGLCVANRSMAKFTGLTEFTGFSNIVTESWEEASDILKHEEFEQHKLHLDNICKHAHAKLSEHWQRIRSEITQASSKSHARTTGQNGAWGKFLDYQTKTLLLQNIRTQAQLKARFSTQEAQAGDLEPKLGTRDTEAKELAAKLQAQAARAGDLEARLEARDAEAKDLAAKLQAQAARAGDLEAKLEARERNIQELKKSTSWRITKPLRAVSRGLRWLLRNTCRALMLVWWLSTGQFRRAAKASLPYYQRFVPLRVKALIPNKLREALKWRLIGNPKIPVVITAPSLKTAVAEAETASDSKDWPEAETRWQAVLERFGDNAAATNRAKLNISVGKRLSNIDTYKDQIAEYAKARATKALEKKGDKKKIVIYTAISGGYDSIKLPEKLDPRFDYVLFTDTFALDTGVYQVRPITYFHEDATRAARFVKTHPHMLLEDYDIAIWIDANIIIQGDIHPLVEEFLASAKAVAAVPHPIRKSIYEELEACIQRKKENPKTMKEQIAHYRQAGFDHGDLIESNLMMFNLRDERVRPFLDAWWTEIDRFSKRDQLSLNYALKQAGVDWHRLIERPNSVRNHPSFVIVPHDTGDGLASRLLDVLQLSFIDPYAGPSYADVRDERIAAQKNVRIDIVVCVHNALEDVQLCLESVHRARDGERERLIVIDDGSDRPTARYLEDFASDASWIELHRNEHASGYTKAANKGLGASTGELVILLNSDTIVTDGWAEKMADAVFSTPGAGIVGPMSNAASHQSIPEHRSSKDQTAVNELPPGVTAEDINRYCEQWTPAGVHCSQ